MNFLRRNWALLLAAALVPFVVLLAFLQQEWIRQMGDRERARLRQGLYVSAGELVAAFQRELLLAPLAVAPPSGEGQSPTFVGPAGGQSPAQGEGQSPAPPRPRLDPYAAALRSGDWSFFAERWRSWKNYALDPSIVSAVHLALRRPGDLPLLRSWNGQSFVPETDAALRGEIDTALKEEEGGAEADRGLLRIGNEEWDIVPLPGGRGLHLIIRYDLAVLTGKVLPALADRHLGPMSDYRFRIVDRESGKVLYRTDPRSGDGGFEEPDLRMGLFRRNFAPPEGLGALGGVDSALMLRSSSPRDRDAQIAALFDKLLGESAWTLEAVHRNGSLASAVRASTLRNLLASTGILLLLLATILVLALSNRRAQALAARQEEFVASVTHELKTPLAVIGSAAANLADGLVREEAATRRYGSTIGGEIRRLAAMIDKLLLYTRLGATRAVGAEEFDFATLVAETLAERAGELEALGFRVERSLPSGPLLLRGDAAALKLAVANLVSNVIVHAGKGAYLGVFLAREAGGRRRRGEEMAVLRIDDRGPGIPRRERAAVFEAFYRGRLAQANQEPGSGIGLNLVRRVVLAHGGNVTLESAEGFGTSISLRLPLAQKGMDDARQ